MGNPFEEAGIWPDPDSEKNTTKEKPDHSLENNLIKEINYSSEVSLDGPSNNPEKNTDSRNARLQRRTNLHLKELRAKDLEGEPLTTEEQEELERLNKEFDPPHRMRRTRRNW